MYAVKSKILGYYHVLLGYDEDLYETDIGILEKILAAYPYSLREDMLGNLYNLNSLNKLVKADFITRILRPLFGICEYKINPKGIEYLKYRTLSRGTRINILLAILAIAATIITGILTSDKQRIVNWLSAITTKF